MTPLLNASAQNTCVIEYGKIENSIESVGFIAREEKILTTINNLSLIHISEPTRPY